MLTVVPPGNRLPSRNAATPQTGCLSRRHWLVPVRDLPDREHAVSQVAHVVILGAKDLKRMRVVGQEPPQPSCPR